MLLFGVGIIGLPARPFQGLPRGLGLPARPFQGLPRGLGLPTIPFHGLRHGLPVALARSSTGIEKLKLLLPWLTLLRCDGAQAGDRAAPL